MKGNGNKVHGIIVEPEVHANRQTLPGHVRQHVHQAITALATAPRSQASRDLNTGDLDLPAGVEIRRVRLNRWRIIYAVHDDEQWVSILGLQRRPPYDYSDLAELVARLQP